MLDPEGTSHSVLLLVAEAIGTTGEVIVVVIDELVVLEKPGSLLVDTVEYVITAVDGVLMAG